MEVAAAEREKVRLQWVRSLWPSVRAAALRVARHPSAPVWNTLVCMLFAAVVLCALVGSRGGLEGNEADVLPAAKQFVNRAWLPNDWYLNLPIGYRYAFNIPAGLALKAWSFPAVALAGRLVIAVLFAVAAVTLCRAFDVSLWLCLPWVWLFYGRQGLVAGEWILGGLETKPFAYVAVMLAFAALERKRYRAMAAWSGVALSFHLLVGCYALVCTLGCMLLAEHRTAWKSVHRWSWPGLLTGSLGIAALFGYAFHRSGLNSELVKRAGEIYVLHRVPHHVLPNSWGSQSPWRFWLEVCAAGALLLRVSKNARYRTLGQYGLGAVALFAVGLLLAHYGRTASLRLYWFRFGDVMLVLLGWFALALLLSDQVARLIQARSKAARMLGHASRVLMAAATIAVCSWSLAPYFVNRPTQVLGETVRPKQFKRPELRVPTMARWIREHTDRKAVFLVDPRQTDFYVEAERAMLVSFKHSPQAEADILEWYERLTRVNRGRPPRSLGFGIRGEVSASFARLDEAAIRALARDYKLDYILSPSSKLPFPKLYEERGATLYRVK